ncbi:MAG: HEAT repeat domain-containing protein, partial [Betaproteobacteria bacterium]
MSDIHLVDPGLLQRMAWWLAMVLVVWIVGMLLTLWLLRLYRRWREPARQALTERLTQALLQVALGDELPLSAFAVRAGERRLLLLLWLQMQMVLRGQASDRLCELGRRLRLQDWAWAQADSTHYARRMVALLSMGFLRQTDRLEWLQSRLQQGHSHTAIHAGRAMLELDADVHAWGVARALLDKTELDLSLTAVMFKPYRACLSPAMLTLWSTSAAREAGHDAPWRVRWLRLARALQLQLPSAWLAPMLEEGVDLEALIAAIRLFQAEQGVAPLLKLAEHSDWRVRAQVARALSYLGEVDNAPLLVRLTTDHEWWVRFRSAQALLCLPGVTAAKAKEWVSQTGDRYA